MADKPVIFSGSMVRAILDGRKSQTRRVLKPQPDTSKVSPPFHPEPRGGGSWVFMARDDFPGYSYATADFKVPYHVGDRLWVREACFATESHAGQCGVRYDANQGWQPIEDTREAADHWLEMYHYRGRRSATVPSIHMPRWASRLTLTVTDVRVQRLQEISEADARAEGCREQFEIEHPETPYATAKQDFAYLWNSINAKRPGASWDDNPWVVAVTFDTERRNIDAESEAA